MAALSIVLGIAGFALPGLYCVSFAGPSGGDGSWAVVYGGITLHGAIVCVMSLALIVIGAGQLRGRAWADRWSRAWGVAALACVAAMVALSLLVTGPALEAVTSPPPGGTKWDFPLHELLLFPHQLSPPMRAFVLVDFYAPFPIVLLLLSRQPPRNLKAQ